MSNVIETTYIGKRARSLNISPQFDGYSRVELIVDENITYYAGSETGRTLTVECEWGTQQICNDILTQVSGYAYQPMQSDGAFLDPAAELGDGVTVNGTYGGIFSTDIRFGPMFVADISAPSEEEIDHEIPFKSRTDRKVTRKFAQVSAELVVTANRISAEVQERIDSDNETRALLAVERERITAEVNARKNADIQMQAALTIQSSEISAKVSKSGGNPSSFGWSLTDSDWSVFSGGQTILRATKDGLEVRGTVVATAGKIGGMDIRNNALSYNQDWNGINTYGVYVGPNGIQLGKNFKVDNSGHVTAASGNFSGTVYAGNIQLGGNNYTMPGWMLSEGSVSGGYGGQISYGSVNTANTSGGINMSLGYADYANGVFQGWNAPSRMIVQSLTAGSYFYIGNSQVKYHSTRVMTGPNSYTTIGYWGT